MTVSDLTKQAIDAVGTNASSDWLLQPEQHAKSLPDHAGPLKRILEQESLKGIIGRFNEADVRAVRQQLRYKRAGRVGIWTRFMSILIGAAFIFPFENLFANWAGPSLPFGLEFTQAAFLLQLFLLGLAFLTAQWLAYFRPFDKWMEARANAEIARIDLFNNVLDSNETSRPGELPVLPLQLEYFRRYLLDMETSYYKGRGEEHSKAAGRSKLWMLVRNLLIAAAALTLLYGLAAIFGIFPWIDELSRKGFIASATVASAIYGVMYDISLMDMNERNAARYRSTFDNLVYLRNAGLDQARKLAANGHKNGVRHFSRLVNDQISSEHREWVALKDLMPKLNQSLLNFESAT